MSGITYEEYKYPRNDEGLNKSIISLARRNKFYLPNIKIVLSSTPNFMNRNQSYQICLAKKKNKTNDNFKVVGFIIYDVGHGIWSKAFGARCLGSLEYWLVDKKFQGQGIGKKLYEEMNVVLAECAVDNMKVMFDKTNPRLCELYGKLGYKTIKKYDGKEVATYPDNHILMYKIVVGTYQFPERLGGDLVLYESEVAD